MKPDRWRLSVVAFALLLAIGAGVHGWLTAASIVEELRRHWRFPIVIGGLLAIAFVLAPSIGRFVHRQTSPDKQRHNLAWFVLVLLVVGAGLSILSDTFWQVVQRYVWLLAVCAIWLAVTTLLAGAWKLWLPHRLRRTALQLAASLIAGALVLFWINAPFRDFLCDNWGVALAGLAVLIVIAALARPHGLELYTEYPEPDEQQTIDHIINLLIKRLEHQYTGRLTLRDTHPKSNGLLFAEFEVLDLPEELRVGLFATPKTYRCWMRFSNSEPEVTPDAAPDFRGIALKVFDVQGDKLIDDEQGSHDFLMIAHDAFFAGTPKDFLNFFVNITYYGNRLGRLLYFVPKRLRLLHNALVGRRSYGHPFEITWFSCAPYRFGSRVVKYKLHSDWPPTVPDRGNPDYLRERLSETLAERGHTLQLMIQFQEDPHRDLLESTARPWRVPQFRTVARLHIPPQKFNSQQHLQFDEFLTFNPWHCLPEHRPVGGINRARRDVMRAVQEFRLSKNHACRTDVTKAVPDDAPDAARAESVELIPPGETDT